MLVADLAQALRLSPGPLGLALAALSAGGMIGVLVLGRLMDTWGRRKVLVLGCAGGGMFFIALGQVNTLPMLMVLMSLGGALLSGFDLSPTTLGGDYEREHGTAAMNPFFAAQDLGGAIGAAVCGLSLGLGVSYSVLYAALGSLLVILGLASFFLPLPNPPTALATAASHAVAAAPMEPGRRTRVESANVLVNRGVLSALAFVALISVIDAAMEGFSSLYLRDTLGAGPALAGLAIAASLVASGAGRLGGHKLLQRLSERKVMLIAAGATALSIAVMISSSFAVVAGIGLLLLRFSQGPIVPVAHSLAARSTHHRAGQASSLVWVALYAAFLSGPLLVGVIAEAGGLRLALGCFISAAVLIGILATTLAKPVLRDGPTK
ncbi:MFS transporter [Arthrobacter sp. D1-29]